MIRLVVAGIFALALATVAKAQIDPNPIWVPVPGCERTSTGNRNRCFHESNNNGNSTGGLCYTPTQHQPPCWKKSDEGHSDCPEDPECRVFTWIDGAGAPYYQCQCAFLVMF